jgi:hypothetical protein
VVAAPPPEPGLIEPRVEALIKGSGIDFRIGGSQAFYMPAHDYVQVPPPQAYFEPINWHRTALHELGHASGAPHRLNRDLSRARRRPEGQRDGMDATGAFRRSELSRPNCDRRAQACDLQRTLHRDLAYRALAIELVPFGHALDRVEQEIGKLFVDRTCTACLLPSAFDLDIR